MTSSTSTNSYDVIVIGGGAAGMMAAGRAGELGKRVLLIERNKRLGEKLRISGGGRCNITNAEADEKKLLANYGRAEQALYSSFSQFGMKDTFSFFEGRGVILKVEANNRAFPESERAIDVVQALIDYMHEGGVEILTGTKTEELLFDGECVTGIRAGGATYSAASYIVSTGGLSHPETGSNGDGFAWLRRAGHTIVEPTPTIVPLKTKEVWAKKLSGKSAPDAKITFYTNGVKKFSKKGTILFTHFGISGPTILNCAGLVADLLYEGPVTASIDLHPTLDLGILDKRLTEIFDGTKNKLLRNVIKEVTPPGTGEVILSLLPTLDPEKKVHSVLKEERHALAELLKNLPLTIEGLMGFERAVVADGGVVLSELDMRTLQSQKYENLFIIGDLLHITRPSGGYSLQLCWTTGYVAGTVA